MIADVASMLLHKIANEHRNIWNALHRLLCRIEHNIKKFILVNILIKNWTDVTFLET